MKPSNIHDYKNFPNGSVIHYKVFNVFFLYNREDGLAIEYSNGDKYWHKNSKRHRENGLAIEDNGNYYN
jgi:hypothetical protein